MLERFWKILDGFWEFDGKILMDFWEDFGTQTIIRASKETSRSTNHWKGGWMVWRGPKRLALRWGPDLVGEFRRLVFFNLFSRGLLERFFDFWCNFGRFGEAQMGIKIEF